MRKTVVPLVVSTALACGHLFAVAADDAKAGAAARQGITKAQYLDLVETAVSAYTPEHMRRYLADVEKNGIQEHGFPRLAANLGVLVARGRRPGDKDLVRRMMDACCSQMATDFGRNGGRVGNDFSVKEVVLCLLELEKAGVFPKEVTDGWRAGVARAEPETTYSCRPKPGDKTSHNWAVFGGASEQLRTFAGLNGVKAYTEHHFADQMRFFDANGMYKDPHQPLVYDFVTRLQYMLALRYGYDGACRARLEELLLKAAEPTLLLQSTSGEIPYGGRSNQFLHAETHFAAVCEWYAAWFRQRGDLKMAARFRAAAARAVKSLDYWTRRPDLRHIKNRFPLATRHGCEGYGYFDKYMVTMGSWAYLGALFADESVPAAEEDGGATAFATTEAFHIAVLKAGDYTVQYDAPCDGHYDANGVGRVQRRGAPPMLCLAVPCPASHPKPNYTFDLTNETALAVMPGWKTPEGWHYAYAGGDYQLKGVSAADGRAHAAVTVVRTLDWTVDVAPDGVTTTLAGADELALTLPVFAFDGERRSAIRQDDRHLSVTFDGWTCTWETSGTFVDTGKLYANRNGHYRRFEARGAAPLKVGIKIERTTP